MSETKQPSRIVRLTVQNLLRIRAAEVTPDGSLVIVGGPNDAGKSSLLNAIAIALSGKDLPQMPIRKGSANGHVILETDELVVTRRFSQAGGSTLEVRDVAGAKVMSPQAKLDTLVARVTFDPFAFISLDATKQLNTVRTIAGIDFTALDSEYAQKFDSRTEINRQIRGQEGKLTGIHRTPEAPAQEVSVQSLMEELEAAEERNRVNNNQREALSELNDTVDATDSEVKALSKKLAEAGKRLTEAKSSRDALKLIVEKVADVNIADIKARLTASESVNAQVRANSQWNAEHRRLVELQNESGELTSRLEAIKKEKADILEKTPFPVDGLGFSDAGVTYNGVPFDQAGTAVKIRTSVAIARSLHPKLPVMLVRDGSLLDVKSMQLLKEEAEKHGCQIWIEVVGTREDATVVLEEGEVVDRPAARKKAATAATK